MQKFTKAGTVRKTKGKNWEVATSFYWWVNYSTKTEKIIVPKGFTTDFASIPWFLGFMFNPTEYNAAVLHDYLYQIVYQSREVCDKIFFQALVVEECPIWKANIYLLGVRIGGWHAWNKCRKSLIKGIK